MRTKFGNNDYFKRKIDECYFLINRSFDWIIDGTCPSERIPIAINGIYRNYRTVIWCKYSNGEAIENLVDDYNNALKYIHQSWLLLPMKAYKNKVTFNHYFAGYYDEMLEMLSFAVLLNQPKETFLKLAEIIDKDEVKDLVYEFILRKYIEDRPPLDHESYTEIKDIPKLLKNMRAAILEKNLFKASKLMEKYLINDVHKRIKLESGGLNQEEAIKKGNYSGNWDFTVPAISLMLDIDVKSFENDILFPKDIYYYSYRIHHSTK